MTAAAVATLIDRDETTHALRVETGRFTSLLRDSSDPEARACGIWTVRDVAAHAVWGTENYARWVKGESAPDLDHLRNMPRWNVEKVAALPESSLEILAARIEAATDELIQYMGSISVDQPVTWYCGLTLPANVSLSMRVIEMILHGFDVAASARKRWDIDASHALIAAYASAYIAPHFVDPDRAAGFDGALEVRLRGGASLRFELNSGDLYVDLSNGSAVDAHISADPAYWILASSRRRSPVLGTLTGKMAAWGRNPFMPLRFHRIFWAA